MGEFHLENFSDTELIDLANEVQVEQAQRAQRSKLDHIDAELERLRAQIPTASSVHDNQPRAHIYGGGQLQQSHACRCRTCLSAEIRLLEDRRKFVLEGSL